MEKPYLDFLRFSLSDNLKRASILIVHLLISNEYTKDFKATYLGMISEILIMVY